jgi:hypothetical protein
MQMQHRKGKRASHTTTAVNYNAAGLMKNISSNRSEMMDVDEESAPLASFAPEAGISRDYMYVCMYVHALMFT